MSNRRTATMEQQSPDGGGRSGAAAEDPVVGGGGDSGKSSKAPTYKGKSCKGCLYYSSILKAEARNPICVGIGRTLQQVPGFVVGESEMEATKEGRSLADFKYACVGYSVFLNNKENSGVKQENRAELPFCAGIELLVDRRTQTADHAPAHAHTKEDATVRPQLPRAPKQAPSFGEDFFNRFKRNAGLVASGVARNVNRVGSYIKDNLDDIMYPYRRRPK